MLATGARPLTTTPAGPPHPSRGRDGLGDTTCGSEPDRMTLLGTPIHPERAMVDSTSALTSPAFSMCTM